MWVAHARQSGDTKPSHLVPWEALNDHDREADRWIGQGARDDVYFRLRQRLERAKYPLRARFSDPPVPIEVQVQMGLLVQIGEWLDEAYEAGA